MVVRSTFGWIQKRFVLMFEWRRPTASYCGVNLAFAAVVDVVGSARNCDAMPRAPL
jgi:hypothetical protein